MTTQKQSNELYPDNSGCSICQKKPSITMKFSDGSLKVCKKHYTELYYDACVKKQCPIDRESILVRAKNQKAKDKSG